MLRGVARLILKLGRWTPVGGIPEAPKAMLIFAPHTSNWDAVWALTYKVAIDIDVRFFGKQTLFWFPLGNLLRALGCIPLDRANATSAVEQAVNMFDNKDSFYFGLAPEGTRSLTAGWKSGFYRIASDAKVPVYFGFLDYATRSVGIGGHMTPTGNSDADIKVCKDFYKDVVGARPENASPVRFI